MSKILVIGSNSFSGSSFCAWLMEKGYDVFGVSRSEPPNEVFLPYKWGAGNGKFIFRKIDLNTDIEKLNELIIKERFNLIFNFAAQSMVGESWSNPTDWMRTNVLSSSILAEKIRRLDFLDRYIHVTTPEVYGTTDGWVDEKTQFNPSTPYAVSRAAGDMLFKIYGNNYGMPVVSTRAANVYGPGQQLYRIIPRTIFSLINNETLDLHGGGLSTRSFIHIDDVSEATWLIANKGINAETYHISTKKIISIRSLVEQICLKLNKNFDDLVNVTAERMGKDAAYWLDSKKIREELNWTDKISLEMGLDQTIEWVKQNNGILLNQQKNYIHKP